MRKMIFALTLLLSYQSMAWQLVSETSSQSGCAKNIEVQEAKDKSSIILLNSDNHQIWEQIVEVGAGSQCNSHASWSPLGGYDCKEAWYWAGVYTDSYCSSDVGFIACHPRLHHDERNSITLTKEQITYTYESQYEGSVHLQCIYR